MPLLNKRAVPKPLAVRKEKKKSVPKSKAVMVNVDKSAFVRQRGPLCECGECQERGEDAHHCLIGRMKDHPELDVPENLVLVNHFEHVHLRKFNTLEWRKKFFAIQCTRFGGQHIKEWLENLPLELRYRIDFIN